MNHLKRFRAFESLDYDKFTGDIDTLTEDETKTLEDLLLQTESDYTLEELISNLNDIKRDDKIKLYRVIWCKDKEDIDVKRLGNHYVASLDSFDDGFTDEGWIPDLYPFHKENEPDVENDLWLVTILAPTKDIDYKATLVKNIKFPYESEIQLKSDSNIELLEISKYY